MAFRTIPQITNAPVGGRRFFHYSEMEEYSSVMWLDVPVGERGWHISNAAEVMRDYDLFRSNCAKVFVEWPNSSSTAMSTPSLNMNAWIGHASMCIAYGTPEHLTRMGWRLLSENEQDMANMAAQEVIATWRWPDDSALGQLEFSW